MGIGSRVSALHWRAFCLAALGASALEVQL